MIQRWTGVVQEFDGTNVCALLEDETDPSNPREVAIIPLVKMYGYQRHLRRHIRPGAVFTWTIRVRYIKQGKSRKEVVTSEFRFKQDRWTRKDIKRIRREANSTMKWLNEFWKPAPGAGGNHSAETESATQDQTCK